MGQILGRFRRFSSHLTIAFHIAIDRSTLHISDRIIVNFRFFETIGQVNTMNGLKRWFSEGAFGTRDDPEDIDPISASAYTLHPRTSPALQTINPLRAWLRQLAEAGKDSQNWLREGDQWMVVPYLLGSNLEMAHIDLDGGSFDIPQRELNLKPVISGKRFSIIQFSLYLYESAHENVLIVDNSKGTVERFEPNGSTPVAQSMFYQYGTGTILDVRLAEWAAGQHLKYIPPIDFCPIGPQHLSTPTPDELGFCQTWTTLYAHARVKFPNITAQEIVAELNSNSSTQLTSIVNGYAHQMAGIKHSHYFKKYVHSYVRNFLRISELTLQSILDAEPDAYEEAHEIYDDLQDIAKAVQRNPTGYNRRNFDGAAGALRNLGIEITGKSSLD